MTIKDFFNLCLQEKSIPRKWDKAITCIKNENEQT